MEIYKLPKILILHLKRFNKRDDNSSILKIWNFVDFPIENLDLSDFNL